MADYNSSQLDGIARNLGHVISRIDKLNVRLEAVDSSVVLVKNNVDVVYSEVEALAEEFHDFVQIQVRANEKSNAQQRLIRIQQELNKRFGHYDIVRRTVTGILQADDLGIVKKETITNATEELMISTPGYWLAPCLVALAAWINDQPELAETALREGIKRNDEKTSLFWLLVCRRAERKSASLKWTQRYLANQDEENLDRKAIVVLDAYTNGLLGVDSEGVVSRQIDEWLKRIKDKPGFVEEQTKNWSRAIMMKKPQFSDGNYIYLSKHSQTWPELKKTMEGAMLHAKILEYFSSIFAQEVAINPIKVKLDEILNTLVTEFDEEEYPFRKEEKYNQLIVDFDGDKKQADQHMDLGQSDFEERKDLMQILTNAAMSRDQYVSVSTQKFAIALSKEWISNAYNDITAQNRMQIPYEIEINIGNFSGKTISGENEQKLINDFFYFMNREKEMALEAVALPKAGIGVGGVVLFGLGLLSYVGSAILGIILALIGIGMVMSYSVNKNDVEKKRQELSEQFERNLADGNQIIRAALAEIVDFRADFEQKDSESQKVIDFLDQINAEQYVKKMADSNRRVKTSN